MVLRQSLPAATPSYRFAFRPCPLQEKVNKGNFLAGTRTAEPTTSLGPFSRLRRWRIALQQRAMCENNLLFGSVVGAASFEKIIVKLPEQHNEAWLLRLHRIIIMIGRPRQDSANITLNLMRFDFVA